jgi:hypothetical protein
MSTPIDDEESGNDLCTAVSSNQNFFRSTTADQFQYILIKVLGITVDCVAYHSGVEALHSYFPTLNSIQDNSSRAEINRQPRKSPSREEIGYY